ncbi:hypothetical protein [Psychromonas aquatilis]|uniref:Uncharacterized protein n=1 Tax=Psychromonas aquatilis TaxID=2005072 RepID=A0ABU9GR45_9GAMM
MSKIKCDACEALIKVGDARFGDKDTAFCKRCYSTVDIEKIAESKVSISESEEHTEDMSIEIDNDKQNVIVRDIKMPFWSMVEFMVKWAIASIPALIILLVVFSLISKILQGLLS